ncbi:hypothetical protein BDZ85DRAFT_261644 [Elsinoe ampelina]|uniref:Cupin type-1 domain-containing protein n=1 Tax=Elsinoe ampelina TaxID=302913 RepID=A0A6A6GD61_9PEZI|nr:hypothetical protein BDZ85DRAFT_261644 [Elsinoe ampelina]
MAFQNVSPEIYHLTPTAHVPNSKLPVLIYRNVLPRPRNEASSIAALEKNDWIHGGTFKHYPTHHYHTVTHECYAIFNGTTRYLIGKGPLDDDVPGIELDLEAGDLVIQPAGVAHCNLRSSDDFAYIGVYPRGSPHWDNNWCKADAQETHEKAITASSLPVPATDPVHGINGPLVEIWTRATGEMA